MFGMGGSEIIVILIVALLFLGPDKLPQAAKQISKGIRDIKKQSRSLQQQIENDEQIGGAIRDLKSALRGEEAPVVRPRPKREKKLLAEALAGTALPEGAKDPEATAAPDATTEEVSTTPAANGEAGDKGGDGEAEASAPKAPKVTLPPVAGEPDAGTPDAQDDDDLAAMIKPATGTVAKGSETGHG
ncbi:MAG: twin-arginine translocase TatA/TatE family subunit [Deltaproteobacteria bacterium]|nr:twin-arginine translocase TatA/TatE family subunit [Deltaproteobacteria bacterium]